MRPVPIIERIYRAEGKTEGLRAGIDVVLDFRFGQAARDVQQEIATILDPDRLQEMLDVAKTAQSLDAVRALVAKVAG